MNKHVLKLLINKVTVKQTYMSNNNTDFVIFEGYINKMLVV